jgi:hypothetical protein
VPKLPSNDEITRFDGTLLVESGETICGTPAKPKEGIKFVRIPLSVILYLYIPLFDPLS